MYTRDVGGTDYRHRASACGFEIVNDTPSSTCKWQWETSPLGDTLHAQIDVAAGPGSGVLPTDYSACSASNVAALDMAFSVGVRIDKEGCGKPTGRCCYDVPPLGTLDCVVTTLERCNSLFFGEWVEGGSCPPSPACTTGRCCYLDLSNVTQCVITMKSTCDNLDQTSPQISSRPGLWTAAIADCSGGNACPTGHCCVSSVCSVETEIRCLSLGGSAWVAGTTCAAFTCPTAICDSAAACQLPHVVSNIEQGGYVSDADNATLTATISDPTPPLGQFDRWRGFHSVIGCDGGVSTLVRPSAFGSSGPRAICPTRLSKLARTTT
jgi:hypothetical protein